jgi:hypothetical protein
MQKISIKPKPFRKHLPCGRRKALLLRAAKVLQEFQAGPHPCGELSPGEEWLQEEQDKFDARHPWTPKARAKFLRALKRLRL